MEGKQILGLMNYLMLGIIFIFGLISVISFKQRKKLAFLFLMFLCMSLLAFLFFSGPSFIISALFLLVFCLVLFLFVNNQEYYGAGNPFLTSEHNDKKNFNPVKYLVLNISISVFICILAAIVFVIYTSGFFREIVLVASFNTASLIDIINDIGSNYMPIIIIIICSLAAAILWFIGILDIRRKRN